jgi:hypothetical protein
MASRVRANCGDSRMDRSNGCEDAAAEFLARRGSGHSAGVGANSVRTWARTLPRAAAVIDLGCGLGFPHHRSSGRGKPERVDAAAIFRPGVP